ncbi:MAG: DNA repair protein RecO [Eubacteriales bacterium]|nr:DNA repair protein RecO [Eubacteriales bacterium]
MPLMKTGGIVIKTVNTGESDKIITILSGEHGKLQASARASRRPKSRLFAGTQFLCYSDFVLYKGRSLATINSCEPTETFYEIRNDIVRLTYASYMVDLILDSIQEEQPSEKILKLFLNTLHILAKTDKTPELVCRIFELRFLAELGFAPAADFCGVCGRDLEGEYSFSFKNECVLCSECTSCENGDSRILPGTLKALRHILYSKPDNLFRFELDPKVLNELGKVCDRFLREKLEKDYKKLQFLKTLE